jgi:hypothetical protein
MNEQIRELAKEAGYYLYDLTETHECKTVETDSTDEWITLEKFAELIIQDIINVLETKNEIRHIAYTTYDSSMVEATVEKSINAITEHYGMKQHIRKPNERTMGRKVSSL